MDSDKKEPQIPSRALEGRRHVCPAGIRGFPLPKGNRDADKRRLNTLSRLLDIAMFVEF